MNNSYQQNFEFLSQNLSIFIEEVQNKKMTLMATNEWTVKEVLCHIVFWHEIYASNYGAQVKNKDFQLPDGMSTINVRGIKSLKKYSVKVLLSRLAKAHKSLFVSIVKHKVKSMIYSKGGRKYETDDFLSMISRHIATHTKQVRRAK